MPTAQVAKPCSTRISDSIPLDVGMRASYPGKPVASSTMRPIPLLWWLRPVSTHARVGEHSAVVWKLVNRSPSAARASSTGVSMSDPKHPSWANPTSSSTTTSTLGVPGVGRGTSGHHGVDDEKSRPITPPNAPRSIVSPGWAWT